MIEKHTHTNQNLLTFFYGLIRIDWSIDRPTDRSNTYRDVYCTYGANWGHLLQSFVKSQTAETQNTHMHGLILVACAFSFPFKNFPFWWVFPRIFSPSILSWDYQTSGWWWKSLTFASLNRFLRQEKNLMFIRWLMFVFSGYRERKKLDHWNWKKRNCFKSLDGCWFNLDVCCCGLHKFTWKNESVYWFENACYFNILCSFDFLDV